MGLFNLDKIFRPRSIAVVGAGEKPGTIGRALMHNLTDGGFDGDLWPVNPNYAEIRGVALKPYIDRPDYEILMGAKHDDNFGPVILFGSGGIFAEVVNDRAIDQGAAREQMLGAARIIADPDGRNAEFSVLVGDPWQGRGIDTKLLEHLLHIARQRKIEHIWGCVLKENVTMLRLGKKAEFATHLNHEQDVYDLTIDLPTAKQESP